MMVNSKKTRYTLGAAVVVLLVLANMAMHGERRDDVNMVNANSSTSLSHGHRVAMPEWLAEEYSGDFSTVDLFTFDKVDTVNEDIQTIIDTTPTPEPEVSDNIDMVTPKNTIEVLAINDSASASSAMIRYEGEVFVVFPGDIVAGKIVIRHIAENKIEYDYQ